MKAFQMKYNKEFRKDYPETVGETDHDFDTHNYVGWLEEYTSKLISDYKAVLETMQNKIDELEKRNEILEELNEKETDENRLTDCW